MAKINDQRTERKDGEFAYGFVCFTDSFLSNWGEADGGRSLYCLEVANDDEAYTVLANGKARSDMKRGRFVKHIDTVKRGLRSRDHLSIADKTVAKRWYEPNSFASEGRC